MSNKVKKENATSAHIETAYVLELSVGASHVASTLYPTSRQACIEELTGNFLSRHGSTDLKSFLLALAEKTRRTRKQGGRRCGTTIRNVRWNA